MSMKNYNQFSDEDSYLPVKYRLISSEDKKKLEKLIADTPGIVVLDHFALQRKELIKTRMPGRPLTDQQLQELYDESLNSEPAREQGTWVYYPWLNKLVHVLDEDEFVELRTNRNFYKITPQEQKELSAKTLGIIGLSVGHAVAVCIATERICGHLKLADFDAIELSNLNRISTSVVNIGVNKCVSTARTLLEIDPYLQVECYTSGITEENLDGFLMSGSKLDVLIDECDSIDIKIALRVAAKQYGIPVVMETSDRGMLDVERFDRETERPVLHGLLDGIPLNGLKHLTNEQKIPLVLKIADVSKGSVRGKASMLEVGRSISTWPQLASSVTLGGAVVTDVCRRILLDQYHESGRYYVDIEAIAANKNDAGVTASVNPFRPFELNAALGLIADYTPGSESEDLDAGYLKQIITFANTAPSTGNDQPWKWVYHHKTLFLFHDRYRSFSFGDFDHIASNITFGGAIENLRLKAWQLGYAIQFKLFPVAAAEDLVCAINFRKHNGGQKDADIFRPALVNVIPQRITNRNASTADAVPSGHLRQLQEAAESVEGAQLHFITGKNDILTIGKIIGECDRLRLLNSKGHEDFVKREMRWTPQQAEQTKDGIDIRTLGLTGPLIAALSIIKDAGVASHLKKINGAKALIDAAVATVNTASLLAVLTLPKYSPHDFVYGGISMERFWLQATELGYAVHPLISPFYLFPRITKGGGAGLDAGEVEKLFSLRNEFKRILPLDDDGAEVFICKLAIAPEPTIKTLRLPIEETLYIAKT